MEEQTIESFFLLPGNRNCQEEITNDEAKKDDPNSRSQV